MYRSAKSIHAFRRLKKGCLNNRLKPVVNIVFAALKKAAPFNTALSLAV
jgi:hypothetical protein